MYKILAIGNSFSQDATAYLHQIAESAGVESKVANLCIGGCSLETHAKQIDGSGDKYAYMLNSDVPCKRVVLKEALLEDSWDYITIQQASHFSAHPETYFPHAQILVDFVKEHAPTSTLVVHETWAYESDRFGADASQAEMFDGIVKSYSMLAEKLGIGMIRSGEVVQLLRRDPFFDYENGGQPMTRDGYHINIPYGRYATALLWFKVLMGGDVLAASFIPEGADAEIIDRIKRYVNDFVN